MSLYICFLDIEEFAKLLVDSGQGVAQSLGCATCRVGHPDLGEEGTSVVGALGPQERLEGAQLGRVGGIHHGRGAEDGQGIGHPELRFELRSKRARNEILPFLVGGNRIAVRDNDDAVLPDCFPQESLIVAHDPQQLLGHPDRPSLVRGGGGNEESLWVSMRYY